MSATARPSQYSVVICEERYAVHGSVAITWQHVQCRRGVVQLPAPMVAYNDAIDTILHS